MMPFITESCMTYTERGNERKAEGANQTPDEHVLLSLVKTLPDRDAQEMLDAIKDCRQIDYGEW
jgi:hypothetical protein